MKIGLYLRVSTKNQKENSSLQTQQILGEEFSKRFGYEYEIFEDVESGGKLDRKELNRLLELCRNGELDGLWVYDNDRLSRDYDVSGDLRKIIVEFNLRMFVGFEEVKLSESKDRFDYNIRSVMSDYERMRIKERMDFGKNRLITIESGGSITNSGTIEASAFASFDLSASANAYGILVNTLSIGGSITNSGTLPG